MIALPLPFFAPSWSAAPARKPAPTRTSGPIFIHDAVIPCQGETLLSLMLKRDLNAALKETDE